MNRIKKGFITTINYFKFFYLLFKGNILGSDSPSTILNLLRAFVSLESPYYPNSYYMGRSLAKSSLLFQALVDTYLETKSDVTLNQLLEVLKEEFIKREENGRK